ncbi:hypothetical protein Krac_11441 [Ktedonobacter racemifer DSM 44963]|uniref:Uncharacterized protein n=1 Tax=Ktedonobacter racemifer DSM 44963 TaxID=485913 RepID=D6TBS7_KTERA|nr:hypothetical protein Krac_11441 [Ktedonobacter racemifer DSM 44963]
MSEYIIPLSWFNGSEATSTQLRLHALGKNDLFDSDHKHMR